MIPRDGMWMTTKTGKRIYLADPQPDDFCIEDIAHGLSNVTRYSGQCIAFYSVAEHCFRGSHRAADQLTDMHGTPYVEDEPDTLRLAYEYLLHDATEAYIGDMVHPLKLMSPNYQKLEATMQAIIATKYGVPVMMTEAAQIIDKRMLVTEAAAMFTHNDKWWNDPKYPKPFPDEWVKARKQHLLFDSRMGDKARAAISDNEFMPPRQAKRLFLERFHNLRQHLGMEPAT